MTAREILVMVAFCRPIASEAVEHDDIFVPPGAGSGEFGGVVFSPIGLRPLTSF
jgi:hypothetical protein